jgi:cytochrome subunit of sulfide dehydrogenase
MIRPPLPCALGLAAALALPAAAQDSPSTTGRNLAAACATCHGTNGASQGGMPRLAGRERSELVRLMRDFRSGARQATVMHQIARGYSDDQVEAIATYFAAQRK